MKNSIRSVLKKLLCEVTLQRSFFRTDLMVHFWFRLMHFKIYTHSELLSKYHKTSLLRVDHVVSTHMPIN